MKIIAALFMDDLELRPVPGPSTRIDLAGIQFSGPAPAPCPVTIAPHLVVLIWNPPGGKDVAALEVTFHRLSDHEAMPVDDLEPLARNVQPLQVESGKFNYRLVRAEIEFEDYETIVASCRIDGGDEHVVPFTLLPPVE